MRSATMTERGTFHFALIAFGGGTAKHLRETHGVEPTDDNRENIGMHLDAHGIPRDVAQHPRWKYLFPGVRRMTAG